MSTPLLSSSDPHTPGQAEGNEDSELGACSLYLVNSAGSEACLCLRRLNRLQVPADPGLPEAVMGLGDDDVSLSSRSDLGLDLEWNAAALCGRRKPPPSTPSVLLGSSVDVPSCRSRRFLVDSLFRRLAANGMMCQEGAHRLLFLRP